MSKYNLSIYLVIGILLSIPVQAYSLTGFSGTLNAHTKSLELKPASLSGSYNVASVCFLGVGDCSPEIDYGKSGDDYTVDTAKQCENEGFSNSCASGYRPEIGNDCPYDASYKKCCKSICPTNSSPDCTGDIVGNDGCGYACKKCCDDTCPSGSKTNTGTLASKTACGNPCYNCSTTCSSGSTSYSGSIVDYNECGKACKACSDTCPSGDQSYTGSIASYTECGAACRNCSTTCPSGSTSYSGSVVGYNECGTACRSCSTSCPSGYTLSNPGGCYDTTTNECGDTCYKSKACCSDTCPSGSKNYSGSYVGSTECGSRCYSCSNSCSSGSTSYSGSVVGYNECGSACRNCSNSCSSGSTSSSCSSGYTAERVGTTECGNTCYSCVKNDPCLNRTNASCSYGCQTYWSDCSSKCQTCYSDNCRIRTAVSVPANASCTSHFSDCSSKCSAWSCNSGYTKLGGTCTKPMSDVCPSGYTKGEGCGCSYGAKVSRTEAGSICYKCCSARDGICFKCSKN